MTAFSLRTTNGANAVSHLHAQTANATWCERASTQPILGITNGVHPPSWIGGPVRALYETLGADLDNLDADDQGPSGTTSPSCPTRSCGRRTGARSWSSRTSRRRRLQQQFARHGEAPMVLEELSEALDPDVLTIGFARRFATYKRASLIFTDEERLARILLDAERPVQIVFAGKAHPADRPGQRVIQDIFTPQPLAQVRRSASSCSRTTTSASGATWCRASTCGSTTRAGRSRRRARAA